MEINVKSLLDLLRDYTGEIRVVYTNSPSLRKTNNPLLMDKVTCVTDSKYMFGGQSYAERVNDALQSEGKAKVESWGNLPWGNWFIDNRVIENKGAYYLRVYKFCKPESVQYFVNDKPATEEQMKIINSLRSQKVYNAEGQHGVSVENRISLVNLAFSGISTIVLNGVEYKLV